MNATKLACICALLLLILASCGGSKGADNRDTAKQPESQRANQVTLTFFSNNPDRDSGQGKVEQDLIDEYMKLHPEIRIRVLTMAPDSQYQDKIKLYNNNDDLPDIFMLWKEKSYMDPLINNHALAPIDRGPLSGDGFMNESFKAFTFAGKTYGIPKNSDFWVLYYNKKIYAYPTNSE